MDIHYSYIFFNCTNMAIYLDHNVDFAEIHLFSNCLGATTFILKIKIMRVGGCFRYQQNLIKESQVCFFSQKYLYVYIHFQLDNSVGFISCNFFS